MSEKILDKNGLVVLRDWVNNKISGIALTPDNETIVKDSEGNIFVPIDNETIVINSEGELEASIDFSAYRKAADQDVIDNQLQANITAEKNRALGVEADLFSGIDTEQARAEGVEEGLTADLTELYGKVNNDCAKGIKLSMDSNDLVAKLYPTPAGTGALIGEGAVTLPFASYLPLAGGTMTGKITLSTGGIEYPHANGWRTDTFGNYVHKSNDTAGYLGFDSYANTHTHKFYWENGNVEHTGTLKAANLTDGTTTRTMTEVLHGGEGCLALTGGEMTGTIKFDGVTDAILNKVDNSQIEIGGGSLTGNGANLVLRGMNNPNGNGDFFLAARNGTVSKTLAGKADGTLLWDNKSVLVQGSPLIIEDSATGTSYKLIITNGIFGIEEV